MTQDVPVNLDVVVSTLNVGGAERLLKTFFDHLDRDRFRPRLICLGDPGPIGEAIREKGVPVESNFKRSRFDFGAIFRLAKSFRAGHTGVLILINHRDTLFFAAPAARLAGVNVVVNWTNETFKPYSWHWLTMLAKRPAAFFVDRIVAAAKGHARYLVLHEGMPANKVVPIYNGVDTHQGDPTLSKAEAKRRLGIPPEAKTVGVAAMLRPDKAHEVFLAAAKIVAESLPETRFVVMGDGPRRSALERIAAELGLADRTLFLGLVADPTPVYQALDVKVLTSDPLQETLSVAACEAMSVGVPVVSTRVGFMDELVLDGETGFLTPTRDPQATAQAILCVLRDESLAAKLGGNAQALVRREMDAAVMTGRFADLIDEVLLEKRPPSQRTPQPVLYLLPWEERGEWPDMRRLIDSGFAIDWISPKAADATWWGLLLSRFIGGRMLAQALTALSKAKRYAVVMSWSTPYGALYGLLRLTPLGASKTPHVLRDFHIDFTRLGEPVYRFKLALLRLALKRVDVLLVTSEAERPLYAERFNFPLERIKFCPDTPPHEYLGRIRPAESDYVFAYGNSDRDYQTLFAAAGRIKAPIRILTQAPPNSPPPPGVELISERVSEDAMIELIAKARLVVLPLKSAKTAAGQNGLLESAALGVPVAATRNVALLEYLVDGESGRFFAPLDPADLARVVNEMLARFDADPGAAKRMGEAGREAVRAMIERHETVVRNALLTACGRSAV